MSTEGSIDTVASHPLFQPLKVGDMMLSHRVAMAPLTRVRSSATHVPLDIVIEYYKQRGSIPGTLLVSEATIIAPQAGGYENVPEIYTDEQIAAWKKVTEAVHAKGSYIFLQLWALGRAARLEVLQKGNYPYVSASSVRLTGKNEDPRPLTIPEIEEYVQLYVTAAKNAVHRAGFDGVEIHGANGYLLDQFIQDVSNKRTDEYGGPVENRTKFVLNVIAAVSAAVGPSKTAIRFSPWGTFQDMRESDPVKTYSYLIRKIKERHPDLAYLHFVEPVLKPTDDPVNPPSNDFARKIWGPGVILSAGGHTRESAFAAAKERGDVVVFGQLFISNPDLPRRLREGIEFTPYDMKTFYTKESPLGYIDYPFADPKPDSSLESESARL